MKLINNVLTCGVVALCLVLSVFIAETNGSMLNVAVSKPASRLGRGGGDAGVDGDRTICMRIMNTIDNPYWMVDLMYPYYIDHIWLICGADNCSNTTAWISADNVTYTMLNDEPQPDSMNNYFFNAINPMLGRWVRLNRDVVGEDLTFCEAEIMSDHVQKNDWLKMKSVDGFEGSGPILSAKSVLSRTHCAQLCLVDLMCVSINVITGVTSSASMECLLLGSVEQKTATDVSTTYYEMTL